MFNIFRKSLVDILPQVRGKYQKNVSLSKHTWFGVGGPAEIMYHPADAEDLCRFIKEKPYNLPVCLIGGGSNLLIRDGGVPGVVIKLDSPAFRRITVDGDQITCGAGVKNSELKKIMLEKGRGGWEFLCSIPGAIGGSVKTNAGCFGQEVKDVIIRAEIINGRGEIETIGVNDLLLSYRSSYFPDDWIILSLTLQTHPDAPETIKKTPEGLKAWELIKKSGCADLRVGGAKVSDIHCNFLINTGNATARDIETLGETIIQRVKQTTSITLEWEIKRLGIQK